VRSLTSADGGQGLDAIEDLYRQHGDRLWKAVFGYAQDRAIADDAVAEAFTQALRRGNELRDPAAWVWRVAFRVAAGELKHRSRRGPMADGSIDDDHAPLDLLRALGRLPLKQRAAIVLHHYAGYSTREVAEMIGSTPGAVRVYLSVARRRLRSDLLDPEADA
jgi:RNA polymerase sigma-70 factor, ECF subfamily